MSAVVFERQRLAILTSKSEIHALARAVENGVVVPEEGHAQDPNRAVLRVHIDLHEGWEAHVDPSKLRFEEQNVPDAVGFHYGSCHSHHVSFWGKCKVGAVDVEVEGGQFVEVRAILFNGLQLRAELHQSWSRSSNQRGAAVDNGRTAISHARDVLEVGTSGGLVRHVVHSGNPMVLPDDPCAGVVPLLCLLLRYCTPSQKTIGTRWFLEADRELLYTEVHQQC
mmetsp:Transcript_62833/g.132665  ORF Transcript_62833/g.132665 Transcript_62833/m.132665 type:complete len:224 (+) Transcript_62833:617-1288(+)